MLRRNAGQGHGNTDLVIQVTLGFQYIQLLTQYCPDHLLGGGLAHTAGNTDHRQAKAFPIGCAKRLQRFVGKEYWALVEEKIEGEDLAIGRIYSEAPDVDGLTVIMGRDMKSGDKVRVGIRSVRGVDLEGVKID